MIYTTRDCGWDDGGTDVSVPCIYPTPPLPKVEWGALTSSTSQSRALKSTIEEVFIFREDDAD